MGQGEVLDFLVLCTNTLPGKESADSARTQPLPIVVQYPPLSIQLNFQTLLVHCSLVQFTRCAKPDDRERLHSGSDSLHDRISYVIQPLTLKFR